MFNIQQTRIVQHNVRNYMSNKVRLHCEWDIDKPDIILLNETSLNPKDRDSYIKYENYKVYSTARSLNNGSAILVKNNIKHSPTYTGDKNLLAITIGTNKGLYTLATFYRCFDTKNDNCKIPYEAFKKLFNRSHPVFLMGDLNLKHGSLGHKCKANAEGKDFVNQCLNKHSNIHYLGPDFNTWFARGKKSKCDIILGNKAAHEVHQFIEQGKQLGSDHLAVKLTISSKPIIIQTPPIPDEKNANWKKYRQALSHLTRPNTQNISKEEVEQLLNSFFTTVQSTRYNRDIFPLKNSKCYTNVPGYSPRTKQLALCLNNLESRIRDQHCPPNHVQMNLMSALQKELKESRQEDFSNHYQGIADEIDSNLHSDKFWTKVNQSKGNKRSDIQNIKLNNEPVADSQIPNAFKETWTPVFKPNPPTGNSEADKQAEAYDDWYKDHENMVKIEPHSNVDLNRLITPPKNLPESQYSQGRLLAPIDCEEVKLIIKQLKNKKSSGKSGISNRMLKKLPQNCFEILTDLYNACLSLGYFPEIFKQAIVVMIHKKGKPKENPLNYRPISLLEPIGKVYETIINRRLKWYLEDNGLLNDLQFGFRPGRSTHTSINTMLEFISYNLKRGLEVYLLSKDIEKAFDKVYHPALVYKIFNQYNLPELFCKTLANFLVNRKMEIKVNNTLADPFTPEAGVPQGSVLGPLLYLMFINDAPRPNKTTIVDKTGYKSELNQYFADDNIIMVAGRREFKPKQNSKCRFGNKRFREIIQGMSNWEDANRIRTNASKSALLYFSRHTKPFSDHMTLHPNNAEGNQDPIKYRTKHNILGITIDRKLNFKAQINIIKNSIYRQISSMRILKRTSIQTKTRLFLSILQPKINYSCPIYSLLSERQKINLAMCQNIAIYDFVLNHLPYDERPNSEEAHVSLRIKSISQIAWERSKTFYKSLKARNKELFDMFSQYAKAQTNTFKSVKIFTAGLQFARQKRPIFYYNKDYFSPGA